MIDSPVVEDARARWRWARFFLERGVKRRATPAVFVMGFRLKPLVAPPRTSAPPGTGAEAGPAAGNHDSGSRLRNGWSESQEDYNDGMGADKPAFDLIPN